MKKQLIHIIIFGLLLGGLNVIQSCKEEPVPVPPVIHEPTPYNLEVPAYFPPMMIPENNPLTDEGVLLGRHLYYDQLLSADGPMEGFSCSSCHQQATSFSKSGSGLSVLPHVNLGWNDDFLWNGKVSGTMEDIMRFEVEEFFQTDLDLFRNDPTYPDLYQAAFGSKEITLERTSFALAQFFRSLVSYETEFDSVIIQKGVDTYSDLEAEGYLIFFSEKGDCFHCHSIPLLTDNSFKNNGLDDVHDGGNQGLYEITRDPADLGKFKVPTLRNIELTGPYMHDGRYNTLEEVIEHYNSGVKMSSTLDPIMTKPGKEFGLQLTEEEKASLVAFLKTLTDKNFVKDPRFGSPF
jgi:cytochrome c peroxidase